MLLESVLKISILLYFLVSMLVNKLFHACNNFLFLKNETLIISIIPFPTFSSIEL